MFDWNGGNWKDSKHSKETIGQSRANEQPPGDRESAEKTEPVKAWQAAGILMTACF